MGGLGLPLALLRQPRHPWPPLRQPHHPTTFHVLHLFCVVGIWACVCVCVCVCVRVGVRVRMCVRGVRVLAAEPRGARGGGAGYVGHGGGLGCTRRCSYLVVVDDLVHSKRVHLDVRCALQPKDVLCCGGDAVPCNRVPDFRLGKVVPLAPAKLRVLRKGKKGKRREGRRGKERRGKERRMKERNACVSANAKDMKGRRGKGGEVCSPAAGCRSRWGPRTGAPD